MEITINNTPLGSITIKDKCDKNNQMRWITAEFLPRIERRNGYDFTYKGKEFTFAGGNTAKIYYGRVPRSGRLVQDLKEFEHLMTGTFSKCVHDRDVFLDLLNSFVFRAMQIEEKIFKVLDELLYEIETDDDKTRNDILDFEERAKALLVEKGKFRTPELRRKLNEVGDLPVYVWIDGDRYEIETVGIEDVCGEKVFELNAIDDWV